MITETNEVIRTICGKLMRTVMQSDELTLESLCPINSDKELYEGFPPDPQDEGWSQLFNGYIDSLFENGKIPES